MEDPRSPLGQTASEPADTDDGDDSLTIVHVDYEQSVLESVRHHFTTWYDEVTVRTTTVAEAADELEGEQAECLVTESDLPDPLWDHLVDLFDCPFVLYTERDPREISPDRLAVADTLVEKGNVEQSKRFLADKVFGVRQSVVGQSDRQSGDSAETFESLAEGAVGAFLVAEDGSVCWSTDSFDAIFPVESVPVSVSSEEGFYDRLASMLGDRPSTMRDVLTLRGSTRTEPGTVIEIQTAKGSLYYLHYSYPVSGTTDGARLELFQQATPIVEQFDRLDLFERLVENAEDGLYVLDADGRVVYLNDSFAELLGYHRGQLLGTHASKTMAAGELEKGQELVADLLNTGEQSAVVDITFATKDGETVDTSVHFSVRTEDGKYAGLMGVVRDITDRKARERELEEYRSLVESAGDPMYVLDAEGNIQVLNSAMAEFFGYRKAELVGENASTLLPESVLARGRQAIRTIQRSENHDFETFETWLTDASGEDHRYEVTIGTVTTDGQFEGSVATFRDITERYRQREELDLLNQVFSRALRHNLRNRISVIDANLSRLAGEEVDPGDDRIAAIRRASNALAQTSSKAKVVDRIVDRNPDVVEHDLAPSLKRVYAEAIDTNPDADVSIDVPDDIVVRGIPELDFAFANLLENALLYGNDGDDPPTVSVTADCAGDTVTVVIEDDGPGIPESEVEVLERHEETALEHTSGIGLWLTDRVVEKSGGELEFDVSDGTRAIVTLQRVE